MEFEGELVRKGISINSERNIINLTGTRRQRISFGLNVASFTGSPNIYLYINNAITGNMVAIRNNGHIAIDLIYDLIPESGQTTTTLGFLISGGNVTLTGSYGINAYATIECFS